MRTIPNLMLRGLVGLFAFPVFGVLTAGLALCAVVTIVAGILRTIGVDIQMNMVLFEVPRYLSVPVALGFSVLFIGLSAASWRALRLSYRFVVL